MPLSCSVVFHGRPSLCPPAPSAGVTIPRNFTSEVQAELLRFFDLPVNESEGISRQAPWWFCFDSPRVEGVEEPANFGVCKELLL